METNKRIGVVIGNTAYKTSPLINPRNDAMEMSRFLRAQGFDVNEFLEIQTRQISELSEVIRRKVDSDTTLVVFYAGHGIQVEGRNYLPSPDASLQSIDTLKAGSIALDDLLSTIQLVVPAKFIFKPTPSADLSFAAGCCR